MKCPNHPAMDAVFTCARCGRGVCGGCIQERDDAGGWICADCVAKARQEAAGSEHGPPPQEPSAQAETPAQPPPQEPAPPAALPTAQPPASLPLRTPAAAGPSGIAIASMVCGILSLLCCCLHMLRVPLAVAAIVLGVLALSPQGPEGVRQASRPYAIVGIVAGVLAAIVILLTAVGALALGAFRELNPWHRGLLDTLPSA